jgi:hypothetical protein
MLFVAEPYRPLFAQLGLDSVEAVSRYFLGPGPADRARVVVRPASLVGRDARSIAIPVFFKQYQHVPASWAFLGRRSKARCEFDNYGVFARLNLASAEAIAVGEDRDALGRLRRAFILTRAIPAAMTLVEFMQGPGRDRSSAETRALRKRLIRQLAGMTRRIHEAGFFHHDLVWRNVLVAPDPDPAAAGAPRVWWIDCPRGGMVRWGFGRRRRAIKDLASLDKPAGRWCTRAERLFFVREYLGLRRLDAGARQLVRAALHYRKHRWPEDWDGD